MARGPAGAAGPALRRDRSPRAAPPPAFEPVVFEEVAAQRGVRFVTDSGRTPRKHQPETMVAGRRPPRLRRRRLARRLRRQRRADARPGEDGPAALEPPLPQRRRDGSFTDVTEAAGVAGRGYDLGVATGDYDNDGDADIFVAGLRRNTLFRNNGDGTFTDVTEAAGLARPDPKYGTLWAVAAAFVDYDRDGRLDLFVSNYCVWDPAPRARLRQPVVARLLPPAAVRGAAELALPQQRRRHLHRRVGGRPGSAPTSARGWGSGWPTSTTTAGRTSSWPTTPSPPSCS